MKLEDLIVELQKLALRVPDAEATFSYVTCDHEGVWACHKITLAEIASADAARCEIRFTEPKRLAEFIECKHELGLP
jgi:hypothetical protein